MKGSAYTLKSSNLCANISIRQHTYSLDDHSLFKLEFQEMIEFNIEINCCLISRAVKTTSFQVIYDTLRCNVLKKHRMTKSNSVYYTQTYVILHMPIAKDGVFTPLNKGPLIDSSNQTTNSNRSSIQNIIRVHIP